MPARPSRRASRKRALDILYEADLKGRPIPQVLGWHLSGSGHPSEEEPPDEFAVSLVRGVHREQAQLDELIQRHARSWKLSRMPIVDRNLLRMGLYEMLHTDVPMAVVIDEAVELAKELSTEDSGRFINGLLARATEAHATTTGQ
jgi:N utilization substance protein B